MILNSKELMELAALANKNIYIAGNNQLRVSVGAIIDIIKVYEKMKKEHDLKLSETIAEWDEEIKDQLKDFKKD